MVFSIRPAQYDDLPLIARQAEEAQADPARYCAYLGDDAASIAADIAKVVGPDTSSPGDWTTATWVAVDGPLLLGWLLAETDSEIGRVWWWGPLVTNDAEARADHVVDALFGAALRSLGGYPQHEFAIDAASSMLISLASRHGFRADPGSAVLRADLHEPAWTAQPGITVLGPKHRASVEALHDELFAGTHATGQQLASGERDGDVLVAVLDDETLAGYIATEQQSDGRLYIDFLGVAPAARRRGVAQRLVSQALHQGANRDASSAYLTVRADNEAARRTYASLGFVEERVVTPLRRGFSLA